MAEYLIQDTTLNNLGDSIRDLNDTTSTMTPAQMISTVDGAVDEIESQTALIAQCLSALEGKVSGGGSGSGGSGSGGELLYCYVDLITTFAAISETTYYADLSDLGDLSSIDILCLIPERLVGNSYVMDTHICLLRDSYSGNIDVFANNGYAYNTFNIDEGESVLSFIHTDSSTTLYKLRVFAK